MRASAIEFRLRMVIQIVIVFLGFWAPWVGPFDWARRISTLEWLPLEASRLGLASFTVAAPIVIVHQQTVKTAKRVSVRWLTSHGCTATDSKTGPATGSPLPRDGPAHRRGDGRLGHRRDHRRPAREPRQC